MKSYRDLIAWQKTFALGEHVYDITAHLPEHERFGLTSSLRRLAFLIPSLIADGFGQQNATEYTRHLRQARGDLYQVDTQLLFCVKRNYISSETHAAFAERWEECIKILSGLLKSLGG
jgi:four helix bundle protein